MTAGHPATPKRLPDGRGQIDCGLQFLGDRWLLTVRGALAGVTRFCEFQSSLGIAPTSLHADFAPWGRLGFLSGDLMAMLQLAMSTS